MQRKNYILNRRSNKNAFAMIMAIAVIVVISTIMSLSLSMTAQTTKKTADVYLYEQSALLAKSAVEYQLLRIAQNAPCSDLDIEFIQNDIYTITITSRYIYADSGTCDAGSGISYTTVTTPEQNGSVLIDVAVSVNDENLTSEPVRYFRRTVQKL